MDIAHIIDEAASLADSLADSPIYFKSRQAAEGVEAMQRAADAYREAATESKRLDAALWLGEAYLLLSRGLPDTGHTEHGTGWATANQIAKLLGGPEIWEAKARAAHGEGHEQPRTP